MKDEDRAVLEEFVVRYDFSKRPSTFGDPRHCDECAKANRLLLEEDVWDLDPQKLTEPSKSWHFAWMGNEGWRYFLPGFAKAALCDPEKNLHILLERIEANGLEMLSNEQRIALHDLLEYLRASGYAMNTTDRQILAKAIHETRVQQIGDANAVKPPGVERES